MPSPAELYGATKYVYATPSGCALKSTDDVDLLAIVVSRVPFL